MRVRSQSCSEGSDRNYPEIPSFKSIRSSSRDVGITCSVVTREVGVSPQRPRLRNAKTNTSTTLRQLNFSGTKTEEIPPEDIHILPAVVRPLSHVQTKLVKVSPINAINIESVVKTAITKTSATNTDLLKDQVYSDVEMDHNINKAIQMYKRTFSSRLHTEDTRDVEVQTQRAPEIEPVLLIVERRDIAVQSEYYHCRQEAFSQTEDLPRRLVDIGVSVKPRYVETAVEVRPKTRDFGASYNTVNDILCDNCKAKRRSIGVRHYYFPNPLPEEEVSVSLSNIGIQHNKPLDHSSPPANKEMATRSVGCGTPSKTTVSRGTDTNELCMRRSRDFGVNTTKRKLVDAAVGDATSRINSESGVLVCDKCDVAIQSVAKNILTQNSESKNRSQSVTIAVTSSTINTLKTSPSATISRIPRPSPARGATSRAESTSATSPAAVNTEKRRVQRQDTYTKLQPGPEDRRSTVTPTHDKNR